MKRYIQPIVFVGAGLTIGGTTLWVATWLNGIIHDAVLPSSYNISLRIYQWILWLVSIAFPVIFIGIAYNLAKMENLVRKRATNN